MNTIKKKMLKEMTMFYIVAVIIGSIIGASLMMPNANGLKDQSSLIPHEASIDSSRVTLTSMMGEGIIDPFTLMSYIMDAMEDGDCEEFEAEAHFNKNHTHLTASFSNVRIVEETSGSIFNTTYTLEVKQLTCKFRNNYGQAWGFFADYDLWYEDLTITEERHAISGFSIDTYYVDGVRVTHLYTPRDG